MLYGPVLGCLSCCQGRAEENFWFWVNYLHFWWWSLSENKKKIAVYWNHPNFFIFRDINSVSNVVTGEFQDSILLRCKDDNEESLVHYLCQGSGLLMLQTLCILANKVRLEISILKLNTLIHIRRLCKSCFLFFISFISPVCTYLWNCLFFNQIVGRSLEFNLANLLVSLLAVVLKMPLQDYDALYGTEITNFHFVCFIFMDCYCLFSPTLSALIFWEIKAFNAWNLGLYNTPTSIHYSIDMF